MTEAEAAGTADAEMANLGRKYKVPVGLKCLLEELSREVLRAQPANIHEFLADYLEEKCRKMCAGEGSVGVGGTGTGGMGPDDMKESHSRFSNLKIEIVRADGIDPNRPRGGPQGETGLGVPDAMTGTNALPLSMFARPQSAPGTGTGYSYETSTTSRPVSPYGYDANGQPLTAPDPNAPFGYGRDGQPIRGPNPSAPFGYGPDGRPLTALDPRAPNGYGPDGKPLPGLACVAPYGLGRDGKPLTLPDPNAPFGYHQSDGLPVATNDPTAPFGYGPDGNPLQSRDPNAPFGYNEDGQPNSVPERVAFCDEDMEAIIASNYNNPPLMGPDGRPVSGGSTFGAQVGPGGGLMDTVRRIEQRDEQVGANWPYYADGSRGTGPGGAQFPVGMPQGQYPPGTFPPGGLPNGAQFPPMYQNGAAHLAFPELAGQSQGTFPPGSSFGGIQPGSTINGQFSQQSSFMDSNAPGGGGLGQGSLLFVGGPGANMLLSYDPARVNNNQPPLLHMANAATCGMEIGGSVGMLDCAATMRVAMECMLTRVTSILGGVLMQNMNTNAPPAGGNRIGLTEFITNPRFDGGAGAGRQAGAGAANGDARGFTYPVSGDEDGGQGPDTLGDEGAGGEGGSIPQSTAATAAASASRPASQGATTAPGVSATASAGGGSAAAASAKGSSNAAVGSSRTGSPSGGTAAASAPVSKPASAPLPSGEEDEAATGTQPTGSLADMAAEESGSRPISAQSTTSEGKQGTTSDEPPTSASQPASNTNQASASVGQVGPESTHSVAAASKTATANSESKVASASVASANKTAAGSASATQLSAASASVQQSPAKDGSATTTKSAAAAVSIKSNQSSGAPSVPSAPRPKVRRRCIPDELKQFVPGGGPAICEIVKQGGAVPSGKPPCPPVPPRRLRLESLLVTKDSKQMKMGDYIGDILSRATSRIMASRKEGEGIPAVLLRGAAEASACQDGRGPAVGSSQFSSMHEPPAMTCGTGTLADSLAGKSVGAYLREVAPQYQTVLDSALSPDDQTTLTLLTTVGTLLDTIEDTGLTRMDPVQLCSDNTLKSLVDVGEKMMTGLREHLAKVRANPPSNDDPFMAQITREAQDALEIGAESLEVAVGLLKDVVNLCGEMAEHPELLQKCEADIVEARKRTEEQMDQIRSKEIKTCSRELDDGTTTMEGSNEDNCGVEDGEPCVDESAGTGDQNFKDKSAGNSAAAMADQAAEMAGIEAGAVGADGVSVAASAEKHVDSGAGGSKSKTVSASASQIATNDEAHTGASGGMGTIRTESGRVLAQTPSGKVREVTQTASGRLVTTTESGNIVPVPPPGVPAGLAAAGITQTPSGRLVDSAGRPVSQKADGSLVDAEGKTIAQTTGVGVKDEAGRTVVGQTPSGKVLAQTQSGKFVAKTKSGHVVPADEKMAVTMNQLGKGLFGSAVTQSVQSSETGTVACRGRIVLFSVSFVVGVVVGYVLARTFGLFGLGGSSGGSSGRLSGLFWGASDRAVCARPTHSYACPIPRAPPQPTGSCAAPIEPVQGQGCGC